MVLSCGELAEDIGPCPHTVLVITSVCGGALVASHEQRPRDAVTHPVMHRTVSTAKNDLAPNVCSAKIEKVWTRLRDKAGGLKYLQSSIVNGATDCFRYSF